MTRSVDITTNISKIKESKMKRTSDGKVIVVVGGQYGSESKGLVVGHLAVERNIAVAVRTGSINAGHTVYYKGKPYKMQQLPTAWVNPDTKLVIGAGAYISPELLEREVAMVEEATGENLRDRLFIDFRAGIHLPTHHEAEKGMHERMGSTGEGCMEAIIDKMRRLSSYERFAESAHGRKWNGCITDTVEYLGALYYQGKTILLEGTQGTMLDLHFGTYPFVTSRSTIASAWMAEAGLPPNLNTEVAMVCRTFPIRVAGNSGPLPNEISWVDLAEEINEKLITAGSPQLVADFALEKYKYQLTVTTADLGLPANDIETLPPKVRAQYSSELSIVHQKVLESLPENVTTELRKLFEFTTVTKKLRRIARLDYDDLKNAILLNNPDYLVLNFLNYEFPQVAGMTDIKEILGIEEVDEYLSNIQEEAGVPIGYVNTSPDCIIKVE